MERYIQEEGFIGADAFEGTRAHVVDACGLCDLGERLSGPDRGDRAPANIAMRFFRDANEIVVRKVGRNFAEQLHRLGLTGKHVLEDARLCLFAHVAVLIRSQDLKRLARALQSPYRDLPDARVRVVMRQARERLLIVGRPLAHSFRADEGIRTLEKSLLTEYFRVGHAWCQSRPASRRRGLRVETRA